MADYPPPPPPQQPYGAGPVGELPLSQPLRGAPPRDAIVRFFKKYATFDGRASRSEFWWVVLFVWVVSVILSGIGNQVEVLVYLAGLFQLAVLVPYIAVGARRLHDTGRSGWWWLIALVPCVGAIILIVFWATGPKPEGDKYNVA